MKPTLVLAAKPKIDSNVFAINASSLQSFAPRETLTVDLDDPYPIITAIHSIVEAHQYENVELEALVIGVVSYLTLREWAAERPNPLRYDVDHFGMDLFGVRLIADPRRDRGWPVPIYKTGVAIDLYVSKRLESGGRK